MEIRTLIETELAAALQLAITDGTEVVTGVSDAKRPPHYIAVVCPEPTEPRGFGACRVLLEFRCVAPLFGPPPAGYSSNLDWLQSSLSKVLAWGIASDSLLRGAVSDDLKILGCSPPSNRSEARDKQRVEVAAFYIGAQKRS